MISYRRPEFSYYNKIFSGQNFDDHFNSNHHSIKTKKKSTLHTCSHCTKSFPSAHYLKFHENSVHIKSNNVQCQICNKTFTGDYYLRQHIKRDFTKLHIISKRQGFFDPQIRKILLEGAHWLGRFLITRDKSI